MIMWLGWPRLFSDAAHLALGIIIGWWLFHSGHMNLSDLLAEIVIISMFIGTIICLCVSLWFILNDDDERE